MNLQELQDKNKIKSFITEHGTLYTFYCPGCKSKHTIDETWKFNGNFEQPSFIPSILVIVYDENNKEVRCHSYVSSGFIIFLSDCTHDKKRTAMELPLIKDL